MPPPSPRQSRPSALVRAVVAGHACGAVVVVLVARTLTAFSLTLMFAWVAGFAFLALSAARRRPGHAPVTVVCAAAALAVIGVTPPGAITVIAGALLGFAAGSALPTIEFEDRTSFGGPVAAAIELDDRSALVGAAAAALELGAVAAWIGAAGALRAAFVLVAAAGAVAFVDRGRATAVRGRASTVVAALVAVGLVAWVGGNDPTVEWFGHIATHGDRHGNEVALTFDDGPDAQWSLAVARILDDHDVKGTFFEVGKAVDARPDITKALYDDGQLLGNHSYHHDYTGWLDPRYPELGETQDAFERALGVCPALFRPPHGQRTPFMLAHVADRGMHTVTWDVSARDWVERDGRTVAQHILESVRPGSIILLHDGLDGKLEAARSVLEAALPEILDGLAAKGLHPVRLDELLGVAPYLSHC